MNPTKHVKRMLALVVIVAGAITWGAGTIQAQEGSRQLVPGTPVTGTLNAETFAQTYWFDGAIGQEVTLFAVTTDEGPMLAMLLVDPDGVLVAQDADQETPTAASVSAQLTNEGRYYVTVLRLSGASGEEEGTFSLTFTQTSGEEAAQPTAAPVSAGGEAVVALTAGMRVALTWNSTADLDLEVRIPDGESIYWENPAVSSAVYNRNINQNCTVTTADNPTEQITWTPGAVNAGSYEIIVYYVQGCDNNAPANLTLDVTVDGVALDQVRGTLLPRQEFLSSFTVVPEGPAAIGDSGVNPGRVLTDTSAFLTGQTPVARESSTTGTIDGDNVFLAYSFTGTTGEIVTIRMDAVLGGLDTMLFLIDPNGIVVGVNDDVTGADTTNSEISNQTLVTDGLYTIVATRYGQNFGGTEGAFTLTLTGGQFEVPPALAGLDLPAGSIEVSLLWNTNADLQLLVRDPSGAAVYDDFPRSNSGGILEENGNVGCTDTTTSPVSFIYWPTDRLPPGTYEVEVWYQNNCTDISPVTFNLTTRVNGQVVLSSTAQPSPGQIYLTSFTVDVNGFATPSAGGFIGDSSVLDLGSALPGAVPIEYGDTVAGTINQSNKFILYTFEGEVGDQVRIGMQATAGTLDTTLILLSPEGAQLALNDDAVVNETTDSLIDAYTLPANGTYIIVASHYGLLYGGTSGTYNLSLTRLN